ncbi:hypothetical protein DVH24_014874 [Malus domestica]|uniref:Uncharacterized protein n=1 Tax=Malus domestica TaxID=3750 RepID=A0A498K6K7_MALDO|nr:hypothetical protein DVH24_014874 [Malus domestica]
MTLVIWPGHFMRVRFPIIHILVLCTPSRKVEKCEMLSGLECSCLLFGVGGCFTFFEVTTYTFVSSIVKRIIIHFRVLDGNPKTLTKLMPRPYATMTLPHAQESGYGYAIYTPQIISYTFFVNFYQFIFFNSSDLTAEN